MSATRLLTSGEASVRTGMTQPQLSTLCKRNLIPFITVTTGRLFKEDDLPKIKAAGLKAGYVREVAQVAAATA